MKKIKILNIALFLSLIIMFSLLGFIGYTFYKQSPLKLLLTYQINPDYLYISGPINTFTATVNSIKGNRLNVTQNTSFVSIPTKNNPSPVIDVKNITYQVLINQDTTIIKTFPSIPYISKDRQTKFKTENITPKDIHPKDFITIQTNTDLRQYIGGAITAKTITKSLQLFFIPGRIENIQNDLFEIMSPPASENPTKEAIKKLNIKSLQILITPETEISYTTASRSTIVTKKDLNIKDVVFIHSFNNPDVEKTITAETISVQKFTNKPPF